MINPCNLLDALNHIHELLINMICPMVIALGTALVIAITSLLWSPLGWCGHTRFVPPLAASPSVPPLAASPSGPVSADRAPPDGRRACLQGRGARAVFQFYPENSAQVEMITAQAMKSGFTGGLVVDYPNSTKAKKMFLVLMTGGAQPMPAALGEDGPATSVAYTKRYVWRRDWLAGRGGVLDVTGGVEMSVYW